MKLKIEQGRQKQREQTITIDTTLAGGWRAYGPDNDESGFWQEMLQGISRLGNVKLEPQHLRRLDRLEDEANHLAAVTVSSRKTARGNGPKSE